MTDIEATNVVEWPGVGAAHRLGRGLAHQVERALRRAADGRTIEAVSAIDGMDEHDRQVAIDALIERSAQVLDRLRHRSQYPIPLGYILERIPLDLEVGLGACADALADAWSRSAEVGRSGPDRQVVASTDELLVALATAAGVVRFAAARWWTTPDAVLAPPVDGGAATARPAQDGSNR